MQEEILIKSQFSEKTKKIFLAIILSCCILSVIFFIVASIYGRNQYFDFLDSKYWYEWKDAYVYDPWYYSDPGEYREFDTIQELYSYLKKIGRSSGFFHYTIFEGTGFFIPSMSFLLFASIFGITYLILRKCELTITEKNIVGTSVFGRKVTLPLYMVSSFSTRKFLSLISVSSASGRTKFYFIANNQEIGDELQNSINERQANTQTTQQTIPTPQQTPTNNLDELKKLKELLDAEIITKEEFEQKKKQMLGL